MLDLNLREAIGNCLTYTPQSQLADQYEADIRTLNPRLLKEALAELTATKKLDHNDRNQHRAEIHLIYNRKVKELAALYPFIFSLENALRMLCHIVFANEFRDPFWWFRFYEWHANGDDIKKIQRVGTVKITGDLRDAINTAMISAVKADYEAELAAKKDAFVFFEKMTFGELVKVITKGWPLFKGCFSISSHQSHPMSESEFKKHMKHVARARNTAFHSNPIADKGKVLLGCEKVLDCLRFHMGDFDAAVGAIKCTRFQPSIRRTPRHVIPAT